MWTKSAPTKIDPRVAPILLGAAGFRQAMDDARLAQPGALHRSGQTILADQLVEPVERRVVGDQEQLADLVAHRDRAAVEVGRIPLFALFAVEERMKDQRRIGADVEAGGARDLAQTLERRHRGEQLDGARRIEVLGAEAETVLREPRAAVRPGLDGAEHGL